MKQKVTYTGVYETALDLACKALHSLGYQLPSKREQTTAKDIKRFLVAIAIRELKTREL